MSCPFDMKLTGQVVTGTGQASGFTEQGHAKQQFLDKLGIDTWPGTLNLKLNDAASVAEWQSLRNRDGIDICPPDPDHCHARGYPVQINGQLTGAIIFPQVDGYPDDQVEIIAPLALRRHFSVNDGDRLTLNLLGPVRAKAVLFDLDGTLVDTVDAFYQLARRTGAEFGLHVSRERMYETLNHGVSYWDHVAPASMENRAALIEKLNLRAMELWPELIKDNAGAFAGVKDTLTGLSNAGYALGIVTGSGQGSLELLYSLGVADLFAAVITGHDVKKRKPDPEGLHKCLRRMGVAPADAVYVGDSVIDILASHAAGVLPIAVLTGAGASASLCEAGAYRIVRSHAQVRGLLAI